MCMKNKMPNTPMPAPAPAPTVQTDDATKAVGEEWFSKKRKNKKGFDSTILSAAPTGTKNTLGG
nr:MAG TPA: hypothetical protein [Caudoviricetes sp.]